MFHAKESGRKERKKEAYVDMFFKYTVCKQSMGIERHGFERCVDAKFNPTPPLRSIQSGSVYRPALRAHHKLNTWGA